MSPAEVAAYPWTRLERVPRSSVRAARHVRRAFPRAVTTEALGQALGELLTSDVTISVRKIAPAPYDDRTDRGVHLEAADGAVRLVVEPEPTLVTVALSRVLGRAVATPPTDPAAALGPTLKGALGALCIEAARRSGALFVPSAARGTPLPGHGLQLDATVRVDGAAYGCVIWLFADPPPTSGEPAPDLALLGNFPITVPLVGAVSEGARADVESLSVGDVWLPGDGWLHRGEAGTRNAEAPAVALIRRGCLASPAMERGVETGRSDDGRIVVRPNVVALAAETRPPGASGERSLAMSDPDETLREMALEAPVVVRVEVASITLTAREWAKLGPGDVIETGVSLAEPVVLRVGGREVARGELVSVDGELGVRIREIVDPGRKP